MGGTLKATRPRAYRSRQHARHSNSEEPQAAAGRFRRYRRHAARVLQQDERRGERESRRQEEARDTMAHLPNYAPAYVCTCVSSRARAIEKARPYLGLGEKDTKKETTLPAGKGREGETSPSFL